MKTSILLITKTMLLLSLAVLVSCSSGRRKALDRISLMQDSLYVDSTGMVDLAVASRLLEECVKYASDYPDDSASARMLIKAKDYALYINDPVRSVKIMEQFITKYPNHASRPDMLFSLAFVYENYLGDLSKAKETYEAFIHDYPDMGKLSNDARFALDHLGMSADEILEEITHKADSLDALSLE